MKNIKIVSFLLFFIFFSIGVILIRKLGSLNESKIVETTKGRVDKISLSRGYFYIKMNNICFLVTGFGAQNHDKILRQININDSIEFKDGELILIKDTSSYRWKFSKKYSTKYDCR